jgi:hypothetical protein
MLTIPEEEAQLEQPSRKLLGSQLLTALRTLYCSLALTLLQSVSLSGVMLREVSLFLRSKAETKEAAPKFVNPSASNYQN